jgi:hypothetical protein
MRAAAKCAMPVAVIRFGNRKISSTPRGLPFDRNILKCVRDLAAPMKAAITGKLRSYGRATSL